MKTLLPTILLTVGTALRASDAPPDLIVHEWGTFTSVQGGDGKLIPWQAQQIGDLPPFVYNWLKPGRGRTAPTILTFGKGGLTGLQRMETPVIYFYSDREFDADVTVRFRAGHITEWFPQADDLGEAGLVAKAAVTLMKRPAGGSLIRWQNVRVLPAKPNASLAARLPTSTNAVHYFAARETDSAFVRATDRSSTNFPVQYEKFLFYRGTGNFETPLTVTTSDDGTVGVANGGQVPLDHLYLLQVKDGRARWTSVKTLGPRGRQVIGQLESSSAGHLQSVPQVQRQLGDAMAQALTDEGLFPAEARAMVNTWRNAWFTEEGVRVLYILPRSWTDEILPITLDPKPRELVRVMVGRAEVFPPGTLKELAPVLARSNAGEPAARNEIAAFVKKYGRFASPAFQLARAYEAKPTASKPLAAGRFE